MPEYWNESRTSLLKILLEQGLSAQEIANVMNKHFNSDFTRNAIIGRVHRIKAEFKKKPGKEKPAVRNRKVIVVKKLKTIELPNFIDRKTNITLMELSGDSCRWPIGERPPYLYCGEQIQRGSYCAQHAEISYIKPTHYFTKRR